MVARIQFTKTAIAELPFSNSERLLIQDAEMPHLFLRVGKRTKTFYVLRRAKGRKRYLLIGDATNINPVVARKRASVMLGEIAAGIDPTAEKLAPGGPTLKQAWLRFKANRKLKPKTLTDYQRRMDFYFKDWLDTPLGEITGDMVSEHYRKSKAKQYANGCMRVLRSVYNYARAEYRLPNGKRLLPENPVSRLSETKTWVKVRRRTTHVKAQELPEWLKAVQAYEEPTVRDFLLVVLLTGLRKDEARLMEWSWLDFQDKVLTIPEGHAKNSDPHILPLSDPLYEILHGRFETRASAKWVFPGEPDADDQVHPFNGYWKHIYKITAKTGIKFSIHDLRRNFTTAAESLDLSSYTLKRLLNHRIDKDVTGGYVMRDVERLRSPMQRIAQTVLGHPAQSAEPPSPH